MNRSVFFYTAPGGAFPGGTTSRSFNNIPDGTLLGNIDVPDPTPDNTTDYVFAGWGKLDSYPITQNVSFKAVYEPRVPVPCTLTLKGNQGKFSNGEAQIILTVVKGTLFKDIVKETPKYLNHNFAGWTVTPLTAINDPITASAQWSPVPVTTTPTTYTVYFNSNGGSSTSPQTVEIGQPPCAPPDPIKSGYNFTEWSPRLNTISSACTTYAQWSVAPVISPTPTTYVVNFYPNNGGNTFSQTVKIGEYPTTPTEPIKNGYNFTEWSPRLNTISSACTTYAQWSVAPVISSTYTITFDPGGGMFSDGSSYNKVEYVTSGQPITLPGNPTKLNSDFKGWNSSATVAVCNTTITALWVSHPPALVTYTCTFDTSPGKFSDGTSTKIISNIPYGTTISPPNPLPIYTGYILKGWTKSFYITADIVNAPIWQADIRSYTVILFAGDGQYKSGEIGKQYQVIKGQPLGVIEIPTKSNSTFESWSPTFNSSAITADTVSTATYVSIPLLIIKFGDGCNGSNGIIYEIETVPMDYVTYPPAPIRTGYTFAGWNSSVHHFTSNATINATWNKNPMFRVTFSDGYNNHNLAQTPVYNYGDNITLYSPTPTRPHYNFTNWDHTGKNITSNITITALWEIKPSFLVTFYSIPGIISTTQYVYYGENAIPVDPGIRSGWYFIRWIEDYTNITKATDVYAQWQAKTSFIVTYYNLGAVYATRSVYFGEDATTPSDPTNPDLSFAFGGWSWTDKQVTANRDISAVWINKPMISVYYFTDLTIWKSQWVIQGQDAVVPSSNPTKADCVFNGWDNDGKNITQSRVIYALWGPSTTYTVTFDSDGGSYTPSPQIVFKPGIAITPSPEPVRIGYGNWRIFNGWLPALNVINTDTTTKAQWLLAWTVNYYNGGLVKAELVQDGHDGTPPIVSKVNHTFNGWSPSYLNIVKSVDIVAQWVLNATYTVTFDTSGGSPIPDTIVPMGGRCPEPTPPTKTNYVFTQWVPMLVSINEPATTVAQWVPGFTVNFYDDTILLTTQAVRPNYSAVPPINNPTKAHSIFAGWDKNYSVITAPINIYATWNAAYLVTFYDGWSGTPLHTEYVISGRSATPPTWMTRENYTFTNWNKGYSCIVQDDWFEARWTEDPIYSVLFYDGYSEDSYILVVTVHSGHDATPPPDPIRSGYIFSYWDTPYWNITATTVTTAVWISGATYDITYNASRNGYYINPLDPELPGTGGTFPDGSINITRKIPVNNTALMPYHLVYPVPRSNTNYLFRCWNISPNFPITKDTIIYGVWDETVLATFDANGGVFPSGRIIESKRGIDSNPLTFPGDPIKDGYTFIDYLGWGHSHVISSNDAVYEHIDVTYIAQWKAIPAFITVTFDAKGGIFSGGATLRTQMIPYGSNAIPPVPNPLKLYFSFNGWDNQGLNLTDDITINAIWQATLTVTYKDYDGTILNTQEVIPGNSAFPPTSPNRVGYTFSNWDKNSNNIIAPTIITAQYTIIVLNVIFEVNGGSPTPILQQINYGNKATRPANNPFKACHIFIDWYIDAGLTSVYDFNTPVTSNIFIWAKYNPILVTSVNIIKTNITKIIDEFETLATTVLPNDAYNKVLSWTTTDSNIANVDNDGKVTGINAGIVTIKATSTDGTNISDTCSVTIIKPAVTSISIIPNPATVEIFKQVTLTAICLPPKSEQAVTWLSLNTSIVTINNNGLVTGIKSGLPGVSTASTTVTATSNNGLVATDLVTVTKPPVTGIVIVPCPINIKVNEVIRVKAICYPPGSEELVTWATNSVNCCTWVADIDGGTITGARKGITPVIATATDGTHVTGVCATTVTDPDPKITLNKEITSIKIGLTEILTYSLSPPIIPDPDVEWASSNPSIATVDQTGLVTAIKFGSSDISIRTLDDSNLSDFCVVMVNKPADYISVTGLNIIPESVDLFLDKTITLPTEITPTNATNKTLIWTSSNQCAATVDDNGTVTAKNEGIAIITAKIGDDLTISDMCYVITHPTLVSTMTINPDAVTLNIGLTQNITVTVSPSDAKSKVVNWVSSNPLVASVDGNGCVYALASGVTVITVTAADGSGVSKTCVVTVPKVTPTLVASLTITNKNN